jgi:outer membrane receptor protein involved in Fe transport
MTRIGLRALLLAATATGAISAYGLNRAEAADATTDTTAAADTSANTSGAIPGVEEVIVTAQRRQENVQKVPMTVQALTGATLKALNIDTLNDLLRYTPNVSLGSNGPGQGNIFMRGLSAGFVGEQSQATIGSFPNVAIYLDDQSMQFPSHNADVYMVDMERVEILEGPQGTLFGGGAEAGAVRYITNKPRLDRFSGSVDAMGGLTVGGAPNYSGDVVFNVPIVQDKLAVRFVAYDEHQGGYIDNVPGTFTRSNQDPGNFYLGIAPNGAGICPNGKAAGPAGCTFANPTVYNNYAIAKKDYNPVDYRGGRAALLWDVAPDWDVLITESLQDMDAEGMFAQFPYSSDFQPLGPLQVTDFEPSWNKDQIENTSWTLNGKVGPIRAIYTGGYSLRHINTQEDYTSYSRTGGGMLYQCTGPNSYWGNPGPTVCNSPIAYWNDKVRSTHLTNEVRFSSPDDWRLRFIVGGFQENFRIYDNMNFNYKSIPSCTSSYLAQGQAFLNQFPCVANLIPGFAGANPPITTNDPSVRGDTTAFGEDTQRGYDQYAIFGSLDFDIIPKVLTLTAGTRWYNYNEFEVGSQYEADVNGIGPGNGTLDTPNGECGSPCITNIDGEHYKTSYRGFKSRFGVTWHIDDNNLAYFTYSEGFRPGGFNRSNTKKAFFYGPGKTIAQYHYPTDGYAPDTLTNFEIGLKSSLFDHRLQVNVSGYYMNWDNVQYSIFDPPFGVNTTFLANGPNYRILGLEGQFVARLTEGLTLQGSGSYNHNTVSSSPCLVSDVPSSPTYGNCITLAVPKGSTTLTSVGSPLGVVGSDAPFSPAFQGNIRLRYEWNIASYHAFAQVGGNYVGSIWNEPAGYFSGEGVLIPSTTTLRYHIPGYATLDASVGVSKDNWHAELYGTNLTDSHASTFTTSGQFIEAQTPLRPLVMGFRVGADF